MPDLLIRGAGQGRLIPNNANQLYRNSGNGTFTEVAPPISLGSLVNGRGDGVACSDFNDDGFLDLYIVNRADQPTAPIRIVALIGSRRHTRIIATFIIAQFSNFTGWNA
jgi:hypothetical protein